MAAERLVSHEHLSTLRLVALAVRCHWDAQKANRANLIAATAGMFFNNVLILWGLWAMLFDGKPGGERLTVYFLSLNAMITIAWGAVCFFFGGLRTLGETVEQGALEPMLATPRDPLLLAGLAQSDAPSLGDILQGMLNLVALFWIASPEVALRCALFVVISAMAFVAVFVLTGSIPFFVARGSAVGQLLLEINLSLSFYPSGKIFGDRGRVFLYVTPAAATALLPMEAIEAGTWWTATVAAAASCFILWVAVRVFRLGLRRYQASSYVVARG